MRSASSFIASLLTGGATPLRAGGDTRGLGRLLHNLPPARLMQDGYGPGGFSLAMCKPPTWVASIYRAFRLAGRVVVTCVATSCMCASNLCEGL